MDRSGRRATRIAKVVVDVTWWLGLALFVVLLGVFLGAPLLERSGFAPRFDWNSFHVDDKTGPPGIRLRVEAPAELSSAMPALGSADTMRASAPMILAPADSHMEFGTRHWGFFYAANATLLPVFAALLLGVYLLRSFLSDVLAAQVFTDRNAQRLSRLGWLMIVLGVLGPQLEHWRARLILSRIRLDGATLSPAETEGNGLWMVGVLVLVLAAAWRYGTELQQERDLTV